MSFVSAQDIENGDDINGLFSYDASLELTNDDSLEVALDESQLDSNVESEDVISQNTPISDADGLIEDDSDNQMVNMGSSNSYLLRASSNTYSAFDNGDISFLTSSESDSFDVLAADGDDDTVAANDNKKETQIIVDDIVGTQSEIVNVYAVVLDSDNNAVTSGTLVFTTNGQTYYSKVRDGLAIFYDVELPMADTIDEMRYLENDNYKGSSVMVNIIVEIVPGDFDNQDDILDDVIENESTTNQSEYSAGSIKEPISNLGKYPTANPIMVLLLALVAMVGAGIKRK